MDPNIQVFNDRRKVERAVRGFLFRGYYLGIVDVNLDKSYKINDLIAEKAGQQYLASQGECLPRAAKRKCLKNWSEKFHSLVPLAKYLVVKENNLIAGNKN